MKNRRILNFLDIDIYIFPSYEPSQVETDETMVRLGNILSI